MTYVEVRELAYLGATVLHEDAIYPVKAAVSPFIFATPWSPKPRAPGLWPRPGNRRAPSPAWPAAGGYSAIQVEKGALNSEVGYCRKNPVLPGAKRGTL